MRLCRLMFVAIATISISACTPLSVATIPVKEVARQTPIAMPEGQTSKPIQLKKIVMKLDRGTTYGTTRGGSLCIERGNLVWTEGTKDISNEYFSGIFREQMDKSRYNLVGKPSNMFEEADEWKAELAVGGLVTDIRINACFPKIGFGNTSAIQGESYMKINWQVFSRSDRKVVYETTTEGFRKRDEATSGGLLSLYGDAFEAAVNNLLADRKFFELASGLPQKDHTRTVKDVKIRNRKLFEKPIAAQMDQIRQSSVTVFSGKGHGSGVFISSEGYILTNQHVVGDSKFVKIRLATGRDLLGEVVKANPQKDTALIKVEEAGFPTLPIQKKELNVGEEVYAIGTPLDAKFQNTVSKGILSGYRLEEGTKFLQSDVTILPGSSGGALVDGKGNLVGITCKGIAFKGAMAGLNFFLPIQDSLTALDIIVE